MSSQGLCHPCVVQLVAALVVQLVAALVAHWLGPLHSLFIVRNKEYDLWQEPQVVEMTGGWPCHISFNYAPFGALLGHFALLSGAEPIQYSQAVSLSA